MAKIASIKAREILDSRANPTISVDVILDDGSMGRASVPAGASKGINEALELRDGDPSRYHGLGVLKAVSNVNTVIASALIGQEPNQEAVDRILNELDGTPEKKNLGANALIGTSIAVCKAAAASFKIPLYKYLARLLNNEDKIGQVFPSPLSVLISGGAHAKNNLEFQEFLISPIASSFSEQIRMAVEVFQTLTSVLKEKAYSLALGDEGGYGPDLPSNEEAIKVLLEAIGRADYVPERDIILGLDVASSRFWQPPKYVLEYEKRSLETDEFISYLKRLVKLYPIKVLEDPLSEEDWMGWQKLTSELSDGILIVGDDLFATNKSRVEKGISLKTANAVLIKPNQIGTLSETFETIRVAKEARYEIIISHRSGETEDTFISDLAVAAGAKYIKAGAPERGERVIKYNRLLEIEEELKEMRK